MATLLIPLLLCTSGCVTRKFNSDDSGAAPTSAGVSTGQSADMLATQEFYAGLNAPPGSAARKRAGVLLEQEVLQKAFGALPSSADSETARNFGCDIDSSIRKQMKDLTKPDTLGDSFPF